MTRKQLLDLLMFIYSYWLLCYSWSTISATPALAISNAEQWYVWGFMGQRGPVREGLEGPVGEGPLLPCPLQPTEWTNVLSFCGGDWEILKSEIGDAAGKGGGVKSVYTNPLVRPVFTPSLSNNFTLSSQESQPSTHPYRGAGVYFIPSTRHPYSYVRWNAGVTGEGDIRGSKVIGQERPWGWEDNQPLCSYPTGDMAKGPSLATSLSVSKERG